MGCGVYIVSFGGSIDASAVWVQPDWIFPVWIIGGKYEVCVCVSIGRKFVGIVVLRFSTKGTWDWIDWVGWVV